ncbi:MAG TPA: hypothetical protein VIF44_05330 [Candidatus Limnocylindrales bacterium]|jgi:hypothetical protein
MDHAEAHERIADLALEPRRVIDLETDPAPESQALLAHVRTCTACRADLDAWRRTHEAVMATASLADPATAGANEPAGRPDLPTSEGGPQPPASLRRAVAAIPGHALRPIGDEAPRLPAWIGPQAPPASRRSRWRLPAMAAVLVIGLVVGLGAVMADQVGRADIARHQVDQLVGLSKSVDRVLRDADHTAISLVGLDGEPAGTAAWSSAEIVVMSTALTPPGVGAEYRCWVEHDGQRTPIGAMRFADGVAYWWGPMDRYDDLPFEGGRLGVSLEVTGQPGSGAPVLLGELPS